MFDFNVPDVHIRCPLDFRFPGIHWQKILNALRFLLKGQIFGWILNAKQFWLAFAISA
jgi:hypothetical protein